MSKRKEEIHGNEKKVQVIGPILSVDEEIISFNESEGEGLLELKKTYQNDFRIANTGNKALHLKFFTRGFSEPHDISFDPSEITISKDSSAHIIVKAAFRCTTNLCPEKAKICCEINSIGSWGEICGIDAHTDITKIISCDDLEISQEPIGKGRYYYLFGYSVLIHSFLFSSLLSLSLSLSLCVCVFHEIYSFSFKIFTYSFISPVTQMYIAEYATEKKSP